MPPAGFLERTASVNGLKLAYQEWGDPASPPIILLHGFGLSGHMFDEFSSRMKDGYRLLALDQRGHGDSDWASAGDYSRDSFVEDLEGFRKALAIERFTLVGHSMGGLNAVAYANKYPARLDALVLVDVGPEAAKEGVDNIARFTQGPDELEFDQFVELTHRFNPRRSVENIRERMSHRLKPIGDGKWTWKFDKRFRDPESGLTIGSSLNNDEAWQLFRNVAVPALIVRGEQSDVLTADVAGRCAQEMRGARLVTVPDAGHSVPGDNPEAFTAAVRTFIEEVHRGSFGASASPPAPPLQQLVEDHTAASRRGPGTGLLVAIGAGVVFALAGVGFVLRRRSTRKARDKSVRARARRAVSHPPAINAHELELARERAAEVVHRLGAAGSTGTRRARKAVSEVDLAHARHAASDALTLLSETGRHAPGALRSVSKSASSGRGRPSATAVGRLIPHRRHKPKHRVMRWRN